MKNIEDQLREELDNASKKILETLRTEDNITKAAVALSTTLYSVLSTAIEKHPGGVPEIWRELSNLSSKFSSEGVYQLMLMAKHNAEKKHKLN